MSHPEYHMTVMCSNRSDNLGFFIANFGMLPWRLGHKYTAAPTSITLRQGRLTNVIYDFSHFSLIIKVAASEKPTAEDSDENDPTPRINIDFNVRRVRKFYDGPKVRPQ